MHTHVFKVNSCNTFRGLHVSATAAVYQRAYHLCGGTKGQLSIQMCLFLLTEQPQLLELSTDLLSARISSLSQVSRAVSSTQQQQQAVADSIVGSRGRSTHHFTPPSQIACANWILRYESVLAVVCSNSYRHMLSC